MPEGKYKKHRFILDVEFEVPIADAKALELHKDLMIMRSNARGLGIYVKRMRLRTLEEVLAPPGRHNVSRVASRRRGG